MFLYKQYTVHLQYMGVIRLTENTPVIRVEKKKLFEHFDNYLRGKKGKIVHGFDFPLCTHLHYGATMIKHWKDYREFKITYKRIDILAKDQQIGTYKFIELLRKEQLIAKINIGDILHDQLTKIISK